MNNVLQTLTIAALIINTLALVFVVYQTWLAKKSFEAAKYSISREHMRRQLETLPKFNFVIQVEMDLTRWADDLNKKRKKLELSLKRKDGNILKELSNTETRTPKDIGLNKFPYENMPAYLRELWMSGVQYYFNAMVVMQCLWKEGDGPQFSLAEDLKYRCIESEDAIADLLGYLSNIVPPVILNTPASLSDNDFLRD
jgi:hypothetical protein